MNEKRLMSEIEKLCKDGHTDALLYLCRNYGDAAIEGYRRGYRKAFWTGLGVSSLIVTGCVGVMDNWATITKDDTLQQNSSKTYLVEFNFDKSWEGYSRTVIFEAGPANVVVVLKEYSDEENRCPIPKECLKYGGVKLKIGIYGVKGEEHKAIVGYLTSMIISDGGLNLGGSSGTLIPDEVYSEIMAAIGDLNAAGFEGKTLAEVFREIRDHVCETATDEEVKDALNATFGTRTDPSELPEELPSNTATDKEVSDILDDVFGK